MPLCVMFMTLLSGKYQINLKGRHDLFTLLLPSKNKRNIENMLFPLFFLLCYYFLLKSQLTCPGPVSKLHVSSLAGDLCIVQLSVQEAESGKCCCRQQTCCVASCFKLFQIEYFQNMAVRICLTCRQDSLSFSDRILECEPGEGLEVGRADTLHRADTENAFFNCKVSHKVVMLLLLAQQCLPTGTLQATCKDILQREQGTAKGSWKHQWNLHQ